MSESNSADDKRYWVIGGTTIMGVGIGFIFFETSIFFFIAPIIAGLGLGVALAPFVPDKKN